MAPRFVLRPVAAASLLLSAAVAAQDAPTASAPAPIATPTPAPTSIPAPDPGPSAPPAPILTVDPSFDTTPAPAALPTARPMTPAAAPAAAPAALARPTPTATPSPARSPARAPRPPIETVILPPPRAAAPLWPWLVGGGALLMVVLGWVAFRRQPQQWFDEEAEAEAIAETAPTPPPPDRAPPDRARLTIALRPIGAGLNLISVTAECEVTLANTGGARADDIRAALRLMSAHDGQDAELAGFYGEPVARPATPPFGLAPGEERRFRAVTALPHDAIHALDAGGRPMFVALLAVTVRYHDGLTPRRVGRAFAFGGERGGAAKLAPFWLDGAARPYRDVGARAYGEAVEGESIPL